MAYGAVYRASATATPLFVGLLTNSRGDVVELLDANGNAFAAYRYDPWGLPTGSGNNLNPTGIWTSSTSLVDGTTASQVAVRQVLRYAGYVYDQETGLYYCHARYYDPATRQWLTADPASSDGMGSAYQYCQDDPVELTDPSGCATSDNMQSRNWCGYVHRDNNAQGVMASFNVVANTSTGGGGKKKGHSSEWVGVGGFSFNHYDDNRLLQAGTDMDTTFDIYTLSWIHDAWWEKIQENADTGSRSVFQVYPGDVMIVAVGQRYNQPGRYDIDIYDSTTGVSWFNTQAMSFTPPPGRNNRRSAEWIVEKYRWTSTWGSTPDPSKYVMGNFPTVTFKDCYWFGKSSGVFKMTRGTGVLTRVEFVGDDPANAKKLKHPLMPSAITGGDSFTVTSSTY